MTDGVKTARWLIVMVALSVGVAYVIAYGWGASAKAEQRDRTIAALQAQVRALGGTPVEGPKGDEGAQGLPGTPGADGRPGLDGQDGSPGADGKPGAPGPQGPAGQKGQPGEKGASGDKGDTGDKGEPGARGEQGAPGEKGDQGPPAAYCPEGWEGVIVTLREQDYFLCGKTGETSE